jgi:hypothetical protein
VLVHKAQLLAYEIKQFNYIPGFTLADGVSALTTGSLTSKDVGSANEFGTIIYAFGVNKTARNADAFWCD